MRARAFLLLASVGVAFSACEGTPEVVRDGPSGGFGGADASVVGDNSGGSPFFGDGSICSGQSCVKDGGLIDGSFGDANTGYCGDSKLDPSTESCDDGNATPGDGCSQICEREADYSCPTPGKPCVSTVSCGDGKIGGTEQCDDHNARASDGCDDKCQLEPGWECPFVGLACVAAGCGDGIVAGVESCDDGNAAAKDGCDDKCQLEDGFKCDPPGTKCTATTCGDKKTEGTEQCDDGNFDLGDGCNPFCKREPTCDQGPCVSVCGDGILLGNEICDDGNQRDGDGCSSDCKPETGFTCTQPALPPQIDIPLVLRDIDAKDPNPAIVAGPPQDYSAPNHVDFELVNCIAPCNGRPNEPSGTEDGSGGSKQIVRSGAGSAPTGRGLDLGRPGELLDIHRMDGTTLATVSLTGKPVYGQTRAQCDKTTLPTDANGWDKCTATTMDLDSFSSWYVDHDSAGKTITWPNLYARHTTVLKTLRLLRGAFDETTAAFTAGGQGYTYDSRYMTIDGTIPAIIAGSDPKIRTRGFFPIDELGTTGSDGTVNHDFHFTSEVRFWFQYDSSKTPSLQFSGDDDVWVYVNGHLALDIGGIHGRAAKNFTIDAGNATAWGLANGKVYEIAVFQAERNQSASNYWLTLEGFNASKSVCTSTCGDGIVASDELCDDGPDNKTPPAYGGCSADCKTRGPNCGDGHVDADHEACDDGVNTSVYDFDGKGCAPGCVKPPFCGDGEIQGPEQCDDGKNVSSYGGCAKGCKLAPRCGDRVIQPGEQCDDGPSGSKLCTSQCKKTAPR